MRVCWYHIGYCTAGSDTPGNFFLRGIRLRWPVHTPQNRRKGFKILLFLKRDTFQKMFAKRPLAWIFFLFHVVSAPGEQRSKKKSPRIWNRIRQYLGWERGAHVKKIHEKTEVKNLVPQCVCCKIKKLVHPVDGIQTSLLKLQSQLVIENFSINVVCPANGSLAITCMFATTKIWSNPFANERKGSSRTNGSAHQMSIYMYTVVGKLLS